MKLCIYQTDNNCGWGVKTLENIKKGSFVVEYVGEVITNEEAEERGKKYGTFYLVLPLTIILLWSLNLSLKKSIRF